MRSVFVIVAVMAMTSFANAGVIKDVKFSNVATFWNPVGLVFGGGTDPILLDSGEDTGVSTGAQQIADIGNRLFGSADYLTTLYQNETLLEFVDVIGGVSETVKLTGADIQSGSAVSQLIDVEAGDSIEFSFVIDPFRDAKYMSIAFYSIDGVLFELGRSTDPIGVTGLAQINIPTPGKVVLGFGVIEAFRRDKAPDFLLTTTLAVNNLSITTNPTTVPEPSSVAAFGLLATGLTLFRRRRA